MTIKEFDKTLLAWKGDLNDFINVNILKDVPSVFSGDESKYARFQSRLAKKFDIEADSIVIVGSARLGFSYIKQSPFSLDSDIDIAIVNERLFDEYSQIFCRYHLDVIRHVVPLRGYERSNYHAFLKYFAAGWLRPDKGTFIMNQHPKNNDWWQYFRSISHGRSEVGDHKVNAGIYKSSYYLKEYIKIGLEDHKSSLMLGKKSERLQ